MDLYRIIRDLVAERDRVTQLIRSLEEHSGADGRHKRSTGKRRGRRSMDRAARQQVSERMKRYWEKRRAEEGKAKGA